MNSSYFDKSSPQLSMFNETQKTLKESIVADERPIALVMAGGTGGHIYPGLAVAKELSARGFSVSWLGSVGGMEEQLVARFSEVNHLPITYFSIAVTGVRGKGKLNYISAPSRILKAVEQAKHVIAKLSPNVVIGMGGFVSGPGAFAAWRLKIPVVIHEQNAVAGTTNKLASKFASKVLCAFPNVLSKSLVIGNPVRADIEAIDSPAKRFHSRQGPIRILVLGGSRGAEFINNLVPQSLAKVGSAEAFHVIHQAGNDKFEQTRALYQNVDVQADVVPYIEEMAQALEWADVAICRAGALTVSEFTAAGLGAVFIPLPHAIGDHQTKNAQFMANHNAAIIKPQKDLSPEIFAVFLNELLVDRDELKYMAIRARDLNSSQAAKKFAQLCEELVYA